MKKLAAVAAPAAATLMLAAFTGVAVAGDHHGRDHGKPQPKAHPDQSKPDKSKPDKPKHDQKATPGSSPSQSDQNPEAKVYICHATGSASNPYVLIHVSSHALPAHTSHQDGRDIVLGDQPGPCPTSAAGTKSSEHQKPEHPKSQSETQATVTFCDMQSATSGKLETKGADEVARHEFDGNPEESRDIVPPFTQNGQTFSENWDANGQAIFNAGCNGQKPQPKPEPQPQASVTFCDMGSATSGKLETKGADEVARHEFDGNPEENRDIVPPFTLNGKTFSENWDANGQAIFNAGCNGSSGVQGATTTVEQEKEHGKVFICHATGSATNPYVLIHVSVHAVPAHTRHQDGRDIVLGDKPGPCPAAQQPGTTSTTSATTTTASTTTTTAATTTTEQSTTTTTTAAAAAATPPPSAASGVLGATKAITPSHASSGVLGTISRIGRTATSGTLPFTGLQLWIVELVALGLIGLGIGTRIAVRGR